MWSPQDLKDIDEPTALGIVRLRTPAACQRLQDRTHPRLQLCALHHPPGAAAAQRMTALLRLPAAAPAVAASTQGIALSGSNATKLLIKLAAAVQRLQLCIAAQGSKLTWPG